MYCLILFWIFLIFLECSRKFEQIKKIKKNTWKSGKMLENPRKFKNSLNLLLLVVKITKFLEFFKKITIKTIVFSNSVSRMKLSPFALRAPNFIWHNVVTIFRTRIWIRTSKWVIKKLFMTGENKWPVIKKGPAKILAKTVGWNFYVRFLPDVLPTKKDFQEYHISEKTWKI